MGAVIVKKSIPSEELPLGMVEAFVFLFKVSRSNLKSCATGTKFGLGATLWLGQKKYKRGRFAPRCFAAIAIFRGCSYLPSKYTKLIAFSCTFVQRLRIV